MSNDTQRILEMLSEGKITVEEAERLLEALGANEPTPTQAVTRSSRQRLLRTATTRQGTKMSIESLSDPVPA